MTITTTELGATRVLSWDRPQRRNAWTRAVIEDLGRAIEACGEDPAVRCVVARGAGEHFSAGDDLYATSEADTAEWERIVAAFQRLTVATLRAPVPVLAAIDGVCIGGALEFAASCDLRICTDRARFATPEVRIGLTATNAGTLLLPEVVGETAARRLLLTGELVDATVGEPPASPPRSYPRATWTPAPPRSRAPSRTPPAPPSRRPRPCSTSASATSSTPCCTARPTRACGCSAATTRGPRCGASRSGGDPRAASRAHWGAERAEYVSGSLVLATMRTSDDLPDRH